MKLVVTQFTENESEDTIRRIFVGNGTGLYIDVASSKDAPEQQELVDAIANKLAELWNDELDDEESSFCGDMYCRVCLPFPQKKAPNISLLLV